MKAIIDYTKLKEFEKKKIEIESQPPPKGLPLLIIPTILVIFYFTGAEANCIIGGIITIWGAITKFIINKVSKEQFLFLPTPEKNYIEIPYKSKMKAIDAKVTCHPECNPTRIMQNDSNRLYVFSNSSDSFLI